ncbi:AAA family ATPase [Streptomyces polyrhachis]|uniref:AAA family ATPase n=1 Tax=Streptomyces polyrhachis TaxID=1282885 RepID=A0ABW2GJA8_9ACTN
MLVAERERELGVLDSLYAECSSGQGRLVLISGTVASGKTAFLRSFGDRYGQEDRGILLFATATRQARAQPFGVLRQLLEERPGPAARARSLLEGELEEKTDEVVQRVASALLELAGEQLLTIVVDDVHLVDEPSIRCLADVANQSRSRRVLVVLAESCSDWSVHPMYRIELVRQTHFRRLRLAPLSVAGVREALENHLDAAAAAQLAQEAHRITGGNQLLVRALSEDYMDSLEFPQEGRRVGEGYRQAVLTCLYRCGPEVLEVARGLAVLGTDGSAQQIALLTGAPPHHVSRALQTLSRLGLTVHGRFRHPVARAAVYDDMDPAVLADLHYDAALRIYRGSSHSRFAEHLMAAGRDDASWAGVYLGLAAEEALADDNDEAAVRYLEFGLCTSAEGKTRADLMLQLAVAMWRSDPAAVARHWGPLIEAQRQGLLSPAQTAELLRMLMWHGATQEAEKLIDQLRQPTCPTGERPDGSLGSAWHWLRHSYPHFLPRHGHFGTARAGGVPLPPGFRAQAAELLSTLLGQEAGTDDVACSRLAEQLLHNMPLSDQSFEAVMTVLQTLIYAGELTQAERWCDDLIDEAEQRKVRWWQAVLSACRAEIDLHRGALAEAERRATYALDLVGPGSWGVGAGFLLGTLVRAATARGDLAAARRHLRTPVPEATFQTRYGLHYLQARGHYYLASGRSQAALEDFRRCGELMTAWGIDAPAFIAWRNDLAEAYLHLRNREKARRCLEEQIDRLDSRSSAVYGASLRLLAQTVAPRDRIDMLKDAIEVLQATGSRLTLAQALHDLGSAHKSSGSFQRARMLLRRARRLATMCGVQGASQQAPAEKDDTAAPPMPEGGAGEAGKPPSAADILTLAEHNVAVLAGFGYTNREIAEKLFVTVSTVEQHLTKVFRKLNVKSRKELPVELESDLPVLQSHFVI